MYDTVLCVMKKINTSELEITSSAHLPDTYMLVWFQCSSGKYSGRGAPACTACSGGKYLTNATGATESASCTNVSYLASVFILNWILALNIGSDSH